MAKSTCWLCREPGFVSQHTGHPQSSVPLVPGDPMSSFGLYRHSMHIVHLHTSRQNIQINVFFLKKGMCFLRYFIVKILEYKSPS